MIDPFNMVASALEQRGKVRYFGADQLRAACPACGGRSTSTLSAKRGKNGGVLLKCFKSECAIEAIAYRLDLEVTDLFPPKPQDHATPRPRRVGLMSHFQAIELIRSEFNIVWVVLASLKNGTDITADDLDRAVSAADRVEWLCKGYAV